MDDSSTAHIGIVISLLREQQRVTQKHLAQRVGVTQSHISRIESGSRGFRLETLQAIAQALGTDLPALINRSAAWTSENGGDGAAQRTALASAAAG